MRDHCHRQMPFCKSSVRQNMKVSNLRSTHCHASNSLSQRSDGMTHIDQSQHLHTWVDLELLLTHAYFMYGSHVLTGQINPRDIKEVWFEERSQDDLGAILRTSLGNRPCRGVIERHATCAYRLCCLQKALAAHRDIAARGGWPLIPDGPKLQRGHGPRVAALKIDYLLTSIWIVLRRLSTMFSTPHSNMAYNDSKKGTDLPGRAVGASTLAVSECPGERSCRVRSSSIWSAGAGSREHWGSAISSSISPIIRWMLSSVIARSGDASRELEAYPTNAILQR